MGSEGLLQGEERKHERSESLSLLQDRGLASGFLGVCSPESADLRRPTGELNPTGFLMMSVLLYTKKNSRVLGKFGLRALLFFMNCSFLVFNFEFILSRKKHERSESLGLLQDRGTRIRFLGVCSPGSVDFRPPTGEL